MKKEPTFIAFSTQKGGAGKTTLTVLWQVTFIMSEVTMSWWLTVISTVQHQGHERA